MKENIEYIKLKIIIMVEKMIIVPMKIEEMKIENNKYNKINKDNNYNNNII